MKNNKLHKSLIVSRVLLITFVFLFFISCKKDVVETCCDTTSSGGGGTTHQTTAYNLNLPQGFPPMPIPSDNPLTEEGVLLGRHLFYEKSLSGDNSLACAGCHAPSLGFSDSNRVSVGIDMIEGRRQSMPLFNIGWGNRFFWDGRAITLEEQILLPVKDPIEMHENWVNAINELKQEVDYNTMFYNAFGTYDYDSTHAAKAMAQFLRTIISGDSKYDKVVRGQASFTPSESNGLSLFNDLMGADCFHCHGGVLYTDYSFRNNGLDEVLTDFGLGEVTGLNSDNGKFKVPSLRNLAFTAPYMHDGRFVTLDEVIEQYSTGVKENSPNIDPSMELAAVGGANLTPQEKADLKAFLLTLTDSSFITNPNYLAP